jgi:hypothetical protein
MAHPDFEAMHTAEDFERYFATTMDHTAFVEWMRRTGTSVPPATVSVDVPEHVTMEVTAVRLPRTMIQRLDELAGNDKAGRSGLIRIAVDELLARIDQGGNLRPA